VKYKLPSPSPAVLTYDLHAAVSSNRLTGLWRLMAGFRRLYLGALLATAFSAAARMSVYPLLSYIIDTIFTKQQHVERLPWLALAIVGLMACESLGSYIKGNWAARTAESVVLRLRRYLFDHIQRLPFAYHDYTQTGDLLERATSDVETLGRFYADQAVNLGNIVAIFIFSFSTLLQLNVSLAWMSIISLPFVLVISLFFFTRISKAFERYQEQEATVSTTLQENLTGIRVVKAFARQDYENNRFAEQNQVRYGLGKRLVLMHSLYWPSTDILCAAQQLFIVFMGASMTIRGEITLGTYLAVIGLVVWIIWPLRNLGRLIIQISTGMVSYDRIAHIIRQDREPLAAGRIPEERVIQGRITFDDVSFAYTPAPPEKDQPAPEKEPEPVLHNITFQAEPGQVIALLGSTGSGKTSVVNLLLRFYDPTGGQIRIDGEDLTDYTRTGLRRQIGIVEQEPFLFSRSLRDNIAYGVSRPVSQEEVEAAARAAAIHEIITTFPEGYNTLVGEKGVTLSGGQRQRIAIARTLLKDPRILILDDATSSVDTETEEQIRTALEGLMHNRTTFIIAHRIQSVMRADLILVLDNGHIIQRGTHAELIAEEGMYRRIYELQSRIEEEVQREVAGVVIPA